MRTVYLVVEARRPVPAQQAVRDGNARLRTFRYHSTTIAVQSLAFRVGQNDRVRLGGAVQGRRPVGRVGEAEQLHSRRYRCLHAKTAITRRRSRLWPRT